MARPKKKYQEGSAKIYCTRNRALKLLQLSLPDFRRLCILKGVYPREPKNKKNANRGKHTTSTTFYYVKDIRFLLHDKILRAFREQKIFAKRLKRAIAKGDYTKAKDLEDYKPQYSLDYIVKERYPTFQDALSDLDDALCLLFLFATLPVIDGVDHETIHRCEALCSEFQMFVATAKLLQKCFVSIKGIYYEALIQGQKVVWLVPHKFSQHVPSDVDFRIMLTFLEFAQTLVSFVNYRLYISMNLNYPPQFDKQKDEAGGGLLSYRIESTAKALPTITKINSTSNKDVSRQISTLPTDLTSFNVRPNSIEGEQEDIGLVTDIDDTLDIFSSIDPTVADLPQPTAQPTTGAEAIFNGLNFYLSRETPIDSLTFILTAFSASSISQPNGGSFMEEDPRITHQICDRPELPKNIVPGRNYVQPQWIFDCVNKCELLPLRNYVVGAELPPHLSPFAEKGIGYDPEDKIDGVSEDDEEAKHQDTPNSSSIMNREQWTDTSDVDSEIEYQNELIAEASGLPLETSTRPKKKRESRSEKDEEFISRDMAKIMMSNKNKRLLESMEYGNKKRSEIVERLKEKKRGLILEEKRKAKKTKTN